MNILWGNVVRASGWTHHEPREMYFSWKSPVQLRLHLTWINTTSDNHQRRCTSSSFIYTSSNANPLPSLSDHTAPQSWTAERRFTEPSLPLFELTRYCTNASVHPLRHKSVDNHLPRCVGIDHIMLPLDNCSIISDDSRARPRSRSTATLWTQI